MKKVLFINKAHPILESKLTELGFHLTLASLHNFVILILVEFTSYSIAAYCL